MKECEKLIEALDASYTAYQVCERMTNRLKEEGYQELDEGKPWKLKEGGKYFVTRNGSSCLAFNLQADWKHYSFMITAAHGDSPTLKIKPQPCVERNGYTQLNTEVYGGPIRISWFDRPLTIAGRIGVSTAKGLVMKNIVFDHPVALIPHVAPHMDPKVNQGFTPTAQQDLIPLVSCGQKFDFLKEVAKVGKVTPASLVSYDLYVVPCEKGMLWGAGNTLVSAPRIDDLGCAYTTLEGFLASKKKAAVKVYCCFDNEECGSRSIQGAGGDFLRQTLTRINLALGKTEEELQQALASSFLLSADNGHATHPNHPEKNDITNLVKMNEGVIVKRSANLSYATDAVSEGLLRVIASKKKVPLQIFVNHSDIRGGGTLGGISLCQVSVHTADIGLPQLAMHSAYETCGAKDVETMVKLCTSFFDARVEEKGDGTYEIQA